MKLLALLLALVVLADKPDETVAPADEKVGCFSSYSSKLLVHKQKKTDSRMRRRKKRRKK